MHSERLNRIAIDDAQCGGRPCIRGMRIRVTDILELLAAGATFDEVLEDYPYWSARTSWPPCNTLPSKPITRY